MILCSILDTAGFKYIFHWWFGIRWNILGDFNQHRLDKQERDKQLRIFLCGM